MAKLTRDIYQYHRPRKGFKRTKFLVACAGDEVTIIQTRLTTQGLQYIVRPKDAENLLLIVKATDIE